MKTRDEYVTRMKTQLDRWSDDIARWEEQAKRGRDEVRQRYAKDLADLRAHREKALYQMKLVQGASATAWREVAQGTDAAWDVMRRALENARTQFEKKP